MSEKIEKLQKKPDAQYLKITFVGTGKTGTETPGGIALECVGLTTRQIALAAIALFENTCSQFAKTDGAPKDTPLTKFLIKTMDIADAAIENKKEDEDEDED